MTAQIAEKFIYEGREYHLLCVRVPENGSTGASAAGSGDKKPDFDSAAAGLELAPEEISRLEFGVEQGRFLLKRLYTATGVREADLPFDYTGRLLVCRGLLHRYYSEAPWSYQESLELAFEHGFLRESNDVQPVVRAARELLFAPERQEELYALAESHWWLSRCLGLSGSPADAPQIAGQRTKGEHF